MLVTELSWPSFLARERSEENTRTIHALFRTLTYGQTCQNGKGKRWKSEQREGLLKIIERIKQRAQKLAVLNAVSSPHFATPYRKELFGPAEMRDLTEQWQEYLLFVAHRSTYREGGLKKRCVRNTKWNSSPFQFAGGFCLFRRTVIQKQRFHRAKA